MVVFVLCLALSLTLGAHGYVSVPGIFSDGMVLQEHSTYDQRPMIYGQATQPGELVTVIRHLPSGHNDTYYATADATSFWIVQLDPDYFSKSQNNLTIYITGSVPPLNTITIRDVVYGDVFLCSGQSNMNENVAACFDNVTTMSQTFPNFRLFSMAEAGATTPQNDIPAFNSTHTTPCSFPQFPVPNTQQVCNTWQSATEPTVIGSFSATCFYTALALSKTINDGRYFGLIHASVSGTGMKLWAAQPAISKCDSLVDPSQQQQQQPPPPDLPTSFPNTNSSLWNAMIAPISRYSIRAVIWNQGESDSGESPAYFSCLFQSLIESWRRAWRIGDFAWVYAQLGAQDAGKWPSYGVFYPRLAQSNSLPGRASSTTDTLGMAVTGDIGDMESPYPPYHVHARNKTEVGRRLALALLHVQYALQWPSNGGVINLTKQVDWAPPTLTTLTPNGGGGPPPPTSYTLTFKLDNASTLTLDPTPDCWECCTSGSSGSGGSGRDLIQFNTAQGSPPPAEGWVNSSVTLGGDGVTVIATPTIPALYTSLRYMPNMWPQCVLRGATNGLPVEPFVVNFSSSSSSSSFFSSAGGGEGVVAGALASPLLVSSAPTPISSTPTLSIWQEHGWLGRTIKGAENCSAACVPPMGFNTWNSYHCNLDDQIMRRVADALVATGLAALGYTFVNMDDCWQVDRYSNGTILADPVRFPLGVQATAEYVHSLGHGMKFGLYTAQREYTCQERPGSWRFEAIDVDTYCRWGIDYIKTDACGGRGWEENNVTWIDFRAGINRCSHPMVLSVESCNDPSPGGCSAWIGGLANLWRTTGDIQATFDSVLGNLDGNNDMAAFAGPGHWNDPDMLQIGDAGLSPIEARSHFGAWAVVAAPLLIAADVVSGLDPDSLEVLSAPEVIAVDQDALGVQGVRVSPHQPQGTECWARPLHDGGIALLLLNRAPLATANVLCDFAQAGVLKPGEGVKVRDLWARADLGVFQGNFTAVNVPPHGSMLVKLTQ